MIKSVVIIFLTLFKLNSFASYALNRAAKRGDIEECKSLINMGIDPDVDLNDFTPLFFAIKNQHLEIIKFLLDSGADINKTTRITGETVLYTAVMTGNLEIVQLLLDRGAYVNIIDFKGLIPLHFAAYLRHLTTAKLLLDRGAWINKQNKTGHTSLYIALGTRDFETIRLFLDRGADPNVVNDNGTTCLFTSYYCHEEEFSQIFLANGAIYTNIAYEKNSIIDRYNNLKITSMKRKLDLPIVKRIKTINHLVAKNIRDEAIIKSYHFEIFPEEIWCFIFSYLSNDQFKVMQVSKYFYKAVTALNTIIFLMPLIPLDKKIRYLRKHNIEFPPAITWEEVEEFAKENGIEF